MTKFSTMTGLIALAAVGVTPVLAQTVADSDVPTTSLNIPGNVRLFGEAKPNVYRPSATVNGEIITATDIEQRMALIRIANNNVELPPEEIQRLRSQVFSNLIDEKLQIQEAKRPRSRSTRMSSTISSPASPRGSSRRPTSFRPISRRKVHRRRR